MNKEKPPVLSDEEIEAFMLKLYNSPHLLTGLVRFLIQQAKKDGYKQGVKDQYECQQIDLEQAKAETDAISYTQGVLDGEKKAAREIFEEIESWKYVSPANLYQCTMNEILEKLGQSLKSKYMEGK